MMKRFPILQHFWAPVLAALGLVAIAMVFAHNVKSFRDETITWAQRDLSARTELATETLREMLDTQDLRRIRAFADACLEQGVRLTVSTAGGGRFFSNNDLTESYCVVRPCGEYQVRLDMSAERVDRPFVRATHGFALAFCVGLAGMFFVFFSVYRQRVRIRELARLEKFRRDFIADVSHEIKTPLTGIMGAVEMLEGEGEGRRKLLISLIGKESKRLNALVQSILDLARLERAGDVLHCEETNLSSLVRESVAELEPKAEAAHVRLEAKDIAEGVMAFCDAQLVSQALANLVENAICHAQTPDVAVGLELAKTMAVLTVTDHGIGIPQEHAARIFERFYRVDPARAAESGGAGLGLAIVRRVARLHGGDVTLKSAKPRGSVFTLTLPAFRNFGTQIADAIQ